MKKIEILIPFLSGYGGTEVVIHNLLKECGKNNRNMNISVDSIGGFLKNNYLNLNNVHIIKYPNNRFIREIMYIFSLPFIIPYFIMKNSPDIVISTTPVMWTLAKLFIKIFHKNIPVIGWYHYSFKAKPIMKFCLKSPDYFFTISESGKHELINDGIAPNRIYVIYNPIIPTSKIIRHSINKNHFIYVGRIEYGGQKNLKEMFLALSKIHKKWQLCIYGKGNPENILKLKKLSCKLHISDKIKFMGFIYNVFNHINTADSLLLTSNYEGFPMTIAEAIAHGLFVISSNCPDGPSELINKGNGRLYSMHNINELVNLINNMIDDKYNVSYCTIKESIENIYIKNYLKNFSNDISKILMNKKSKNL